MPENSLNNKWALNLFLFFASIAAMVILPFYGSAGITFKDIFYSGPENIPTTIFWYMRVPRVLVAYMAGATFAIGGMIFQALFRNPLVAPETLGVSAGASLGAVIYIWLGLTFKILGLNATFLFGFGGAITSIMIVWSLSKLQSGPSISKMLLSGIAVSFFFVSLIMFIQYLSDISQSFQITRWLMGGLFVHGYEAVVNILPFALIALGAGIFFANELNLLTTGEETAISRGVDVDMVIKILFFIVSLIIGGIVSICGPIAFVGIISPHICRLLIGSNHRYLTFAVFMFGGIFLSVCDTLGRSIISPIEIPVGIVTAILGGPFFLWLLHTRFNE